MKKEHSAERTTMRDVTPGTLVLRTDDTTITLVKVPWYPPAQTSVLRSDQDPSQVEIRFEPQACSTLTM